MSCCCLNTIARYCRFPCLRALFFSSFFRDLAIFALIKLPFDLSVAYLRDLPQRLLSGQSNENNDGSIEYAIVEIKPTANVTKMYGRQHIDNDVFNVVVLHRLYVLV